MHHITINKIQWDSDNLVVGDQDYFSFHEAQHVAATYGKRCPTPQEFKDLIALGYTWDSKLFGFWIAGNHDTDRKGSLFFKALGELDLCCDQLEKLYVEGHYVTSESTPKEEVLSLGDPMDYENTSMCRNFIISTSGCGIENDVSIIEDVVTYGFSVRLVADV